jgi:hypothetical protein
MKTRITTFNRSISSLEDIHDWGIQQAHKVRMTIRRVCRRKIEYDIAGEDLVYLWYK